MKREIVRYSVVLTGVVVGMLLLTAPAELVEAGGCWGMTGSTTTSHSCGWNPPTSYIPCSDAVGAHNHHHHHHKNVDPPASNRCDRSNSPGTPIPGFGQGFNKSERIAWREVVLKVTGTTMGSPSTTSTTAAPTTVTTTTTGGGQGGGGH